jgi:mycothiol synthase
VPGRPLASLAHVSGEASPSVSDEGVDRMVEVEGPREGEFRWIIVVSEQRDRGTLDRLVRRGLDRTDRDSTIQLWIRDVDAHDDTVAGTHGFIPYRDLWQLTCPLPAAPSTIETRPFEPTDTAELVELNNRAFDWHPEQGGRTVADFSKTMSEKWFDPDGLRLHHVDGRLAGFCWTKIHRGDPPIGEIFVIAVDPDFHGRGLGLGMLYVESDNDAANATYRRIGFAHHRTDRAYRRGAES